MSPWTHVVGWTLIHFVWQGAALAVIAAGALRLCRHRSANARYGVACAVLAAMSATPLVTARVLMTPDVMAAPLARPASTIAAPGVVSAGPLSWIGDGAFSIRTVSADVDALLPVVVFLWLAGVTVLLVRMAGGVWHVRRLHARALAAGPSRWQAAAERLASRLGLRVAVHVVETALVDAPAAAGSLRAPSSCCPLRYSPT